MMTMVAASFIAKNRTCILLPAFGLYTLIAPMTTVTKYFEQYLYYTKNIDYPFVRVIMDFKTDIARKQNDHGRQVVALATPLCNACLPNPVNLFRVIR